MRHTVEVVVVHRVLRDHKRAGRDARHLSEEGIALIDLISVGCDGDKGVSR